MIADLKYALRMLRKNPGFSVLVVFLLAVGIGSVTAMFSILDAWLLEPLHFPDAERLDIVLKSEVKSPTEPKIFDGYRDWEEWARASRSFTNLAGVFWRSFEGKDGAEGVFGMIVTANLFDTLGVKPERGRTFRPADVDGPPVAVIGHELWQNRFGGVGDIVGRTFALASKNYQIIGVMPPGFGLRMIDQAADTQFYALVQKDEPAYNTGGAGPIAALGRLKPGISREAAQAELAAIQRASDELHRDNPKGYTVLLTSLQKDNTRNVRASIWLSAATLGFVLLIVCANVGSLLLGRTLERQREMAIRSALGSGHGRIFRQLLTESGVIAILGGAAGVMFAYGAIQIFRAVNPFGRMPPNPVEIDWRTLAFALLVGIASALVCGLAPALAGANADLTEALKASARNISGGLGAIRSRALLVSGQVALSFVLVVGAGLMIETLAHLESQPLGMRIPGVTVASVGIPKQRWNDMRARWLLYDRLLDKLRATPGVENAAISNSGPLAGGFEDRFAIAGRPEPSEDAAPRAGTQSVTSNYFATLGIPQVAGRSFTEWDNEDANRVVIVNRNAAEHWFAGQNAVGARIKLRDDKGWRTVVGIVGDTAYTFYNTIEWLTGPRIFIPSRQAGNENISPVAREVYVVIRGRALNAEATRSLLKSVDPVLRLGQQRRLDEMVAEVVRQPRLRTRLLGAFAAWSLLLASIGIYGLMTQSVIQRTHEFGIRMALGAEAGDVVRMVVAQSLRLALAGVVAGAASALLMTRIIAGLLYGVKPTDLPTFAIAATVLMAAVLLAALLPARAASRVDPMLALRQD